MGKQEKITMKIATIKEGDSNKESFEILISFLNVKFFKENNFDQKVRSNHKVMKLFF